MIYKIINGLCPDNLKGKFVTRSQISKLFNKKLPTSRRPKAKPRIFQKEFFLLWCAEVERDSITDKNELHDNHVQKEIKGIPEKLASFPEAPFLGRPALYVN